MKTLYEKVNGYADEYLSKFCKEYAPKAKEEIRTAIIYSYIQGYADQAEKTLDIAHTFSKSILSDTEDVRNFILRVKEENNHGREEV